MQKRILFLGFIVLLVASTLQLTAQYAKTDSTSKRWFIKVKKYINPYP